MKTTFFAAKVLILLLPVILAGGCGGEDATFITDDSGAEITGDYLGQTPPGDEPVLFAPGIVNTGMYTRDLTMTPDGDEIYWVIMVGRFTYTTVLTSKRIDGRWTKPEVAPFSSDLEMKVAEPFITPDGEKMYFVSDTPHSGSEEGNHDIWVMDRAGGGWGEPRPIEGPINTPAEEFFPTVTRDGSIYFCRAEPSGIHYIYRSRAVDGVLQEVERLPEVVNCGRSMFNATISPDEDFIIVPVFGRPGGIGGVDYYICFRDEDDVWTGPVNMGEKFNTPSSQEFSANISPDGKYIFFMSLLEYDGGESSTYQELLADMESPGRGNPGIYWIGADVIEELRAAAKEAGDE